MKRTKEVSKKKRLFIDELERPAMALTVTTAAKCEEGGKWCWITTMAVGEESTKAI